MKKFLLTISLVTLVGVAGCFGPSGPQVCIKKACVDVELALTDRQLAQGLQYRESLGRDQGMLFVFGQPSQASFWMKNTLIALDMIWIDGSREIIYIQKNAAPCFEDPCPTYGPNQSAQYVLEVNAGWVDAHDVQVSDTVIFHAMDKSP